MDRKEQIREKLERDTEYFRSKFEELDENGFFDDRFPNNGTEFGIAQMIDSIIHFEDFCNVPENMSF